MQPFFSRLLFLFLFLGCIQISNADKVKILPYSFEKVYTTAIRLIRVDYDFPIIDKDREGGYIIFEYVPKQGMKSRGSIELVKKDKGEVHKTSIFVKIDKQPSYIISEIVEALELKLRKQQR